MLTLLRFLELVQREFSADDARVELGGADPAEGDRTRVWAALPQGGGRVVALWSAPLDEALYAAHSERLRAMAEGFGETVRVEPSALRAPPKSDAQRALDEALGVLARKARAAEVVVIDHASPELWGSSESPRTLHSIDDAQALVEGVAAGESADEDSLALAKGILAARGDEEAQQQARAIVRPFANIYRVVLVYDGAPSQLHADGALARALPVIERLVLALPPRTPPTQQRGAKVRSLRRLRSV